MGFWTSPLLVTITFKELISDIAPQCGRHLKMLPCVEPQQDEPVAEVALLHVEGVAVHDHQDGAVDGVALHLRAEAEGLPVGARDLAQVLVRPADLAGAEFENATVLCSLRLFRGYVANFSFSRGPVA